MICLRRKRRANPERNRREASPGARPGAQHHPDQPGRDYAAQPGWRRFTYANQRAEQVLGKTAGDLLGKKCLLDMGIVDVDGQPIPRAQMPCQIASESRDLFMTRAARSSGRMANGYT